jgi:hypothetical protein
LLGRPNWRDRSPDRREDVAARTIVGREVGAISRDAARRGAPRPRDQHADDPKDQQRRADERDRRDSQIVGVEDVGDCQTGLWRGYVSGMTFEQTMRQSAVRRATLGRGPKQDAPVNRT